MYFNNNIIITGASHYWTHLKDHFPLCKFSLTVSALDSQTKFNFEELLKLVNYFVFGRILVF